MESNIKKWEEIISKYPRYNITKTKQILDMINNETDLSKRRIMRHDLINGTLYVLHGIILRSGFLFLNSSIFDIDDIMCSCIEIWIKYLDNGKVYNVDTFSDVFSSSFYSEVMLNTINQKFPISEFTVLSTEDFGKIVFLFIREKSINNGISYEEFLEILIKNHRIKKDYKSDINSQEKIRNTYNLLMAIADSINYAKMPISRVNFMKYMMIECALEYSSINITDNFQDFFVVPKQPENNDEFFTILRKILDDDEYELLIKCYGINGKEYTLEEVGEEFNISKEAVRQRRNKILSKVKDNYSNYLK